VAALLLALQPDIVKLDRGLVRDVHEHAGQTLRIRNMVGFAAHSGLRVIAEGVETVAEART
jgi:EAL domain-containing protein (putative c-di-GMP-specific phosphodiesterase class I)